MEEKLNQNLQTVTVLVMEFVDEEGNTSKSLSKFPAEPADVSAALRFLKLGCSITLSLSECQVDAQTGKVVSPSPFDA